MISEDDALSMTGALFAICIMRYKKEEIEL